MSRPRVCAAFYWCWPIRRSLGWSCATHITEHCQGGALRLRCVCGARSLGRPRGPATPGHIGHGHGRQPRHGVTQAADDEGRGSRRRHGAATTRRLPDRAAAAAPLAASGRPTRRAGRGGDDRRAEGSRRTAASAAVLRLAAPSCATATRRAVMARHWAGPGWAGLGLQRWTPARARKLSAHMKGGNPAGAVAAPTLCK